MKVLLIHGQSHKGATYNMGRILAEKLTDKINITEFFLPHDLNNFCLGCYSCIEDETKCPYWDNKKRIIDAMQECDVFIFTTPNYCLGPSGAMKSFLDLFFDLWMVHRPKKWMFEKRAVILSASAGASCKKPTKMIKDSLTYWGIPYIKEYGLALHACNWNTVTQKNKDKINKHLEKTASKININKRPYIGIKTKFLFNIMRLTHIKGWDSSPVEKQYWNDNGWLSKARPWNNK